jgi:hypothetical protein
VVFLDGANHWLRPGGADGFRWLLVILTLASVLMWLRVMRWHLQSQ